MLDIDKDEKAVYDAIIVIDTKLYGIALKLDEVRNAFRGMNFPATVKGLAELSQELFHINQDLKKRMKE